MFEHGFGYKRSELHDRYGGNRQSGICNCASNKIIFIFTKIKDKEHIYFDGWKGDYFYYSGEGRLGDMEMTRGNKAILNHKINNKELHLFKNTNERGYWEYVDQFELLEVKYYENLDDNGDKRKAIQFVLNPLEVE